MSQVTGGPACASCGSPMARASDHAGGRTDVPYCVLCADGNGTLRAFADVKRAVAEERFMKLNGMDRARAEATAERSLSHMPAWKKP